MARNAGMAHVGIKFLAPTPGPMEGVTRVTPAPVTARMWWISTTWRRCDNLRPFATTRRRERHRAWR